MSKFPHFRGPLCSSYLDVVEGLKHLPMHQKLLAKIGMYVGHDGS